MGNERAGWRKRQKGKDKPKQQKETKPKSQPASPHKRNTHQTQGQTSKPSQSKPKGNYSSYRGGSSGGTGGSYRGGTGGSYRSGSGTVRQTRTSAGRSRGGVSSRPERSTGTARHRSGTSSGMADRLRRQAERVQENKDRQERQTRLADTARTQSAVQRRNYNSGVASSNYDAARRRWSASDQTLQRTARQAGKKIGSKFSYSGDKKNAVTANYDTARTKWDAEAKRSRERMHDRFTPEEGAKPVTSNYDEARSTWRKGAATQRRQGKTIGNLTAGAVKQSVGASRKYIAEFMAQSSTGQAGDVNRTQAHRAGYDFRDMSNPNRRKQQVGKANRLRAQQFQGAAEAGMKASAQIARGTKLIENEKKNMGKVGRFLADAYTGGVQLGIDVGVGALTGTGMLAMLNRAAGGAVDEAMTEGGNVYRKDPNTGELIPVVDRKKALIYGAGVAGIEGLSEKMFNVAGVMEKGFGKGAGDEFLERVLTKTALKAKKQGIKDLRYASGKWMASALTEGMEEVVAEIGDPILANAVYAGGDAMLEKGTILNGRQSASEVLRAGGLGAVLGGVAGGGGVVASHGKGAAIRDQLGEDNLKEAAKRATTVDNKEDAAKAESLHQQLADGRGITSMQVSELEEIVAKQQRENSKKRKSANDAAVKEIRRNGYSDPGEMTMEGIETLQKRAGRVADKVDQVIYETSWGKDTEAVTEKKDQIKSTMARLQTAMAKDEDVDFVVNDPAARTVFEAVTGVELPAENDKARDVLYTYNAKSFVDLAEIQTINERNKVYSSLASEAESKHGSNGQDLFQKYFKPKNQSEAGQFEISGLDLRNPRDVARAQDAFELFYRAARSDYSFEEVQNLFRDDPRVSILDTDTRRAIYDAGIADYEAEIGSTVKANQKRYGKNVRVGKLDTSRLANQDLLKPEDRVLLTDLARVFGVEIRVVGGEAETEDGKQSAGETGKKTTTEGSYNNGIITLSVDSARSLESTFRHEITHHLEDYAPEAWAAYRNFVVDNWELIAARTGQDADLNKVIKAKKDLYRRHSEQLKREGKIKEVKELTREEAIREVIAESPRIFSDRVLADAVVKYDRTLGMRIRDAIIELLRKIRTVLANNSFANTRWLEADRDVLKQAERMWSEALGKAQENRDTMVDGGEVRLSANEKDSLRDQIRRHLKELDQMDPVANIENDSISNMNRSQKADAIIKEYNKSFKGGIDRENFGIIELDYKLITGGLKYMHTDGEYLSFFALPKVLKRGKIIHGHPDHKHRTYETITIAAPVEINGSKGYMAAAVKMGGKNKYRAHRILNPDGTEFEIKEKTEPIGAGVPNESGQRSAISSASEFSITEVDQESKEHFSVSEIDSEGNTLTEEQAEYFKDSKVRDAFGNLIPVYHSTDADFTIFDIDLLGESTGYPNTGYGFFTTPDKEFSKRFGGNTKKMYANITNPIIHPMGCEHKYPGREDEIVRKWFEATDPEQIPFLEAAMKEDGFGSIYDAYVNAFAFDTFDFAADEREILEEKGYDGIELVEGFGAELGLSHFDGVSSYIAFRSNQLKEVTNENPTESPDIRRSVTDEEYLAAVKRGDMSTAREMVRQKASEAGFHLMSFFHGSMDASFTVFDKDKAHVGGNSGAGFYFTTEEEDATQNYSDIEGADNYFKADHLAEMILEAGEWQGEEVYEYDRALEIAKEELDREPGVYNVYLKYDNPYIRNFRNSTNIYDKIMEDFDESLIERDDYDSDEDYEDALTEARANHLYENIYKAVLGANDDLENRYEVAYGPNVEDIASAIFNEAVDYERITWDDIRDALYDLGETMVVFDTGEDADATMEITRSIIEHFGYDAIQDEEVSSKFNQLMAMQGTTHVIVFSPEQIKLSDPVTYDKGGQPIPLSQRFDTNNDDIRYSVADEFVTLSPERIDSIISEYAIPGNEASDYSKAWIATVNPRDFLTLTVSDEVLATWEPGTTNEWGQEVRDLDAEDLKKTGRMPSLTIDSGDTNSIIGHEGRHRMLALMRAGYTEVPVVIKDISESTKQSKEMMDDMDLWSQDFGSGPVNDIDGSGMGSMVNVYDVIPINEKNRGEIERIYGGDEGVQFSVAEDNAILDQIHDNLGPTDTAKVDEPDTRYSILGDMVADYKPSVLADGATGDLYTTYDGEPVQATVIDMTAEMMRWLGKEDQIDAMVDFRKSLMEFMKSMGAEYKFIGLNDVNNASIEIRRDEDGNPVSIVMSAMVKNGEYPVNFDFSSVCKKREAVTKLINDLSKLDNGEFINRVSLSQENLWALNEILSEEGFETACLGCFVETKRYDIEAWADSFVEKWNAEVDKVNPDAEYFDFAGPEDGSIGFAMDALENFKAEKARRVEELRKKRQAARKRWITKYKKENPKATSNEADKAYQSYWMKKYKKKSFSEEWHNKPSLSNDTTVGALVSTDGRLQKKLRRVDLITPEGIKGLMTINPDVYGVLYGHYGSGTPKPVQPFTPYNSEVAMIGMGSKATKKPNPDSIRKTNNTQIQKLRGIGGLRTQSFSDFLIQNVYDYVQMIADMAARDFPGHAYSKEISFAKIFGMTGLKINMSIMFDIDPDSPNAGLDKDGNYIVADKARQERERAKGNNVFAFSFPWEEAKRLQEDPRYDGNVGTIAVGLSDAHILKMLDDPDIKYIIPYHRSSLPKAIAKASNLELATDYTDTQNTVRISSIKTADEKEDVTSKFGPDYFRGQYEKLGSWREVYAEFNKTISEKGYKVRTVKAGGKDDGATIKFNIYTGEYGLDATQDPKATAEHYFEYCMDNGWMPLFYQFAGHENYYKMLYDFNVYHNDGTFAPQEAVTNTYPEDLLDIIEGYMEASNKEKADQSTKWDGVVEKAARKLDEKTTETLEAEQPADETRFSVGEEETPSEPASEDDVFGWLAEHEDELEGIGEVDMPWYERGMALSRARRDSALQALRDAASEVRKDTRLTHGRNLDVKSVKGEINKLVRGLVENTDTSKKTRNADVKMATDAAKVLHRYLLDDDLDSAAEFAYDVALMMVEDVVIINDAAYREYKDLRDYLRSQAIGLDELETKSGTYQTLRKKNFGRIRISKNATVTLDEIWSEMCGLWPGLFNPETMAGEQLQELSDVLDSLQPYREMYTSEEMNALASQVAMELMEITASGKPDQTYADRKQASYKAKVDHLKERHREAIKEVRKTEREKANKRVKEERAKGKERLKEQKEKAAEKLKTQKQKDREKLREQKREEKRKLREQRDKQRARDEKRRAAAERRAELRKMENQIQWLSERLLNPTDDKHLPEGYRTAVAQLLAVLDTQTNRAKDLEKKYGVSRKRFKWLKLKQEYEKIAQGESYGFVLDEELLGMIDVLSETLEGVSLADVTNEEFKIIRKVVAGIHHGIAMQNKTFSDNLKAGTDALGRKTIEDAEERYDRFGTRKDLWFLNESMATPRDYFEGIGGGLEDVFMALREGMDEHIRDIDFIRKTFTDIFGSYAAKKKPGSELEKWRTEKSAREFELESGQKITLAPSQVMSLYCLMKREQAMGHILGSGIIASDVSTTHKMKELFAGKNKATRGRKVIVSIADVQQIVNSLTPDQRAMADKMQDLLNNQIAEWGNETSMKMNGYRKFEEENYFPIQVSKEYLATDFDVTKAAERVKNPNFGKSVVKGASNPIVIADIFEVVADHCNAMSMYRAFAPAIADFQRVYNYVERDDEGRQIGSVKESIKAAYGQHALQYIETFMTDLNGTTPKSKEALTAWVTKSLANYKKAAIGGNLRVGLQQPTAIIRAMTFISPKYFTPSAHPIENVREMKEHCPIGLWKSWGFNQVDMARSMEDIMMNKEWSRWDMLTMGVYGGLDTYTWGQIWGAVKKEVADKHKEVEVGSQEFWDLCNERASEVFDKTQVVDSVFHRSQVMRNNEAIAKLMTSFMAEPTRTFNMVWGQMREAKDLWRDGEKGKAVAKANRAMGVYITNAAVVAAAAAIADFLRNKQPDDDDDKEGLDLYIANAQANFIDNINPLNMLPIAKDIVSIADGWDTSNMSLEGYEQMIKAFKGLWDDKKTWGEKVRKLVEGTGYVFGIPTKNLWREFDSIMNLLGVSFATEAGEEGEEKEGAFAPITEKMANFFGIDLDARREEKAKEKAEKEKEAKIKKLKGQDQEKIWDEVTGGYTKLCEKADYKSLEDMREILEATGGDVEKFDESVVKWSKTALKKQIKEDLNGDRIDSITKYLTDHGVSEDVISHDVVRKSDTAKEYVRALKAEDEERAHELAVELIACGLNESDWQALTDSAEVKGKATGKWTSPIAGDVRITSHFGRRNAPTAGASSNHPAIDIGVPTGTPVMAADGGVVVYTGQKGGYGISVGIDHGNGYVSYYNHLSGYGVKEGEKVKKGQEIAKSGSTGVSTGPHLDFKILKDGTPVDPEALVYGDQ